MNLYEYAVSQGWTKPRVPWFENFIEHLKEYKKDHGDCLTPFPCVCPDGYCLSSRVMRVRHLMQAGDTGLSQDMIVQLDSLGFVWQVQRFDWFTAFCTKLSEYRAEFGDCRVVKQYVCPDGYKLGEMIVSIRYAKNSSRGSRRVTPAMESALSSLGFVWNNGSWQTDFIRYLRLYRREYGHCDVPDSYTCPDGYRLGSRASRMRSSRKIGPIPQGLIRQMDSLGFVWDRNWFDKFILHLSEYKVKTGDCQIPTGYVCSDGYHLGHRVGTIRGMKSNPVKNRLTREMVSQLNAMEFIWKGTRRTRSSSEYLQHLVAYMKEHGDSRIPVGYVSPDGYKLGHLTSSIRIGHRYPTVKSKHGWYIPPKMEAQLEEVGFVWDVPPTRQWFPSFVEHLRLYQNQLGGGSPPTAYISPDGYALGKHVSTVRQYYRHGSLTSDQIDQIDALGFIWDANWSGRWFPDFVQHLNLYKTEYGSCRITHSYVSPDGYKLGQQVAAVCASIRGTGGMKVTAEMLSQLDAIGLVWAAKPKRRWFPVFIKHLKAYKLSKGDCMVVQKYVSPDGYRLGRCVGRVRLARKGYGGMELTPERIHQLDALGFVWEASAQGGRPLRSAA